MGIEVSPQKAEEIQALIDKYIAKCLVSPYSLFHMKIMIWFLVCSFFSHKISEIKFLFSPDEFSKEPSISTFSEEEDRPIEPISDIGINRINDLMFNNKK